MYTAKGIADGFDPAFRESALDALTASLRIAGEVVLLTIRDFGSGLPPQRDAVPGVGLEVMRLRLAFLEGHLTQD